MKHRGDHYRRPLSVAYALLVVFTFQVAAIVHGQAYFVNAYIAEDNSITDSMQVRIIMVDLDEASITSTAVVSGSGTILNKIPISVPTSRDTLLISFCAKGMMAKNSFPDAVDYGLHYSVTNKRNGSLDILRSDHISAGRISLLQQVPAENGFRLGVVSDTSDNYILPAGLYTLDGDSRFTFLQSVSIDEIPGSLGNISGFALLRKVWGAEKYRLYHSFHNTQYWLVKLNDQLDDVIDSLQLRHSGGQATIYAFHAARDKFYCFHVNYEIHGQYTYKFRQDYYIDPEVLIYDPQTLQLLAQYPITDYPEGNYPGRENGLADIVGDYIIYYFFEDDWMGIYAPAMLFIFDTRTNEASWLRVGWR